MGGRGARSSNAGNEDAEIRANAQTRTMTEKEFIDDLVKNYNEFTRGDLQGVVEAYAMATGKDEEKLLREIDRKANNKNNEANEFQKAIQNESNKIKKQRERYNELSKALDDGKVITFVRKNDKGSTTDFKIENGNVYYRAKEEGNSWIRSTLSTSILKDRLNGWVTRPNIIVKLQK